MSRLSALSWMLIALLAIPILMLPSTVLAQERPGPPADKVFVEVRLTQDVGLADVAAGQADIFMWGVSPVTLQQLSEALRDNLKLLEGRSSFWSYVFNPAYTPELGPGILNTTSGEVRFNPFAIREVRFAMNFALNRKFLVDEVLLGGGEPMFTPIMVSNPFHEWAEPIIREFGLTEEGNLELARQMVDAALTRVAQELEGTEYTLEKVPAADSPVGYWWKFSGPGVPGGEEIVTVKFIVRVEDERREGGRAFASWIEQTGIKVELAETERRLAIRTVYITNPADYQWSIYTEGWISLSDFPYVEGDFVFFYSPPDGFVPALPFEEWLVYRNASIEELADIIIAGAMPDKDTYREIITQIMRLGLQESVRIFAVNTIEYWATSLDMTNVIPGFVTGPANMWFYRTATTPDGVIRMLEFSAAGQLFLTVWNPVLGFTGFYAEIVRMGVRDFGIFPHPRSGEPTGVRSTFVVEKGFDIQEGQLVGNLPVPPDAVVFDPVNEEWVEVGSGLTAISKITYNFLFGNFHDGSMMTIADIMASIAFSYEWASMDGEGDPFYDSAVDSDVSPFLETIKGIKVLNDTAIEVYADFYHPYSDGTIALNYDFFTDIPVQLWDAMEYIVIEGGPSTGTDYYWEDREPEVGLDLISAPHAEDIAAAMENLLNEGWTVTVNVTDEEGQTVERTFRSIGAPYVSPYAAPWLTPEEAAERFQNSIAFINQFGHAYISNGPFFIEQYRPEERFIELTAFRDETYPFTELEFMDKFSDARLRIDAIDLPDEMFVGEDIVVEVQVTYIETFPTQVTIPTTSGEVQAVLMTVDGEVITVAQGELVSPGVFKVIIFGGETRGLDPGVYVLRIFATFGGLYGWREEVTIELLPNPTETRLDEITNAISNVADSLSQFSDDIAEALVSISDALTQLDEALADTQNAVSDVGDQVANQGQQFSNLRTSIDELSQKLDALANVTTLLIVVIVLQLATIALSFLKKK